jgi:hypothetical protein
MKILLSIVGIYISTHVSCFAILLSIPDVPIPKTTAVEAVAIAQKQIKNNPKLVLVAIDWCRASSFQPRISDGTQYHAVDNDPNGYSWFITYVYKDEQLEKEFEKLGSPKRDVKYNSVLVIRVKDDGSIGRLIGART